MKVNRAWPLVALILIVLLGHQLYRPTQLMKEPWSPTGDRRLRLRRPRRTGSFAHCTAPRHDDGGAAAADDHPDAGIVTVSCAAVRYRAPARSFPAAAAVLVGVLSKGGPGGRSRREVIRRTWAAGEDGVFFLVAGPWEETAAEYAERGDLIWIDAAEDYDAGLQVKVFAFLAIVDAVAGGPAPRYAHAFKTDDDSYVRLDALRDALRRRAPAYWGLREGFKKVEREANNKWRMSTATYPEPYYPPYCQGAGYAVSRRFVGCAVGGGHVADLRPLPVEDAAVGMLALRCGVTPTHARPGAVVTMRYRSKALMSRFFKKGHLGRDNLPPPPRPCMKGTILQHRILDDEDMLAHHRDVVNPSNCVRGAKAKKKKKK